MITAILVLYVLGASQTALLLMLSKETKLTDKTSKMSGWTVLLVALFWPLNAAVGLAVMISCIGDRS